MNDEKVNGQRPHEFGADCVRILALILLLWLHFYLRNGFYYTEIHDAGGFIAMMFRPVFFCCVPLFLMLTGYLKCGKKWTPGYYRSLLPVLCSYLIIALIHVVYKGLWLKESAPEGGWLLGILSFNLVNYSWYVEMYIGLFLISPLLNTFWSACTSRRQHLAAVLTMAAVTFLPSTGIGLGLEGVRLPAFFLPVYFVTYYLMGCYVRTYRPRPPRLACVLLVPAVSAALSAANLLTRTEAAKFYSGLDSGNNNLFTALMAAALFLAVYQADGRRPRAKKIAAGIAGVVFEMYLTSYFFDSRIYVLHYQEYPMSLYLPVGLLMTGAVFLLSFVSGWCVKLVTRAVMKLIPKNR